MPRRLLPFERTPGIRGGRLRRESSRGRFENLDVEPFRFALERIKPSDAVIVGMYPRFEDEVRFNAGYARKYAGVFA
jgi:hypothetical protein